MRLGWGEADFSMEKRTFGMTGEGFFFLRPSKGHDTAHV